jgi:hypothetical protein
MVRKMARLAMSCQAAVVGGRVAGVGDEPGPLWSLGMGTVG